MLCRLSTTFNWTLPNIFCHGPAHFAALRSHFVLMLSRLSTTFKSTAVCAPPNTVQLISRCQKQFFVWMIWSYSKPLKFVAGPCSPNCVPVPFAMLKNLFVWMLCNLLKPFNFLAGRAPQPPLSRPNSFRGVKKSFRFMQIVNNVQIKGGSFFAKHGPAYFAMLKRFFVLMVLSFSKTLDFMAGPCSPKHGPAHFTVSKTFSRLDGMKLFKNTRICGWAVLPHARPNPFVLLENFFIGTLCFILNTFKLMPGPRSPTSFVTAQLNSRRLKVFTQWCYADFQHCSNERLVVNNGWSSTTFKSKAGHSSPSTVQLTSRCWSDFSSGWY